MKTFQSLLLLILFSAGKGKGQSTTYYAMPDSNAVWNIHFYYAFCGADANYSIQISGDTLINSQTYHQLTVPFIQVIANPCGGPLPLAGYKGAIRQDTVNKKVFFVPPTANSEQLLYDFGMQLGDTVRGYLESNNSQPDVVQSIDSVLVGTNYHKRWNINSCYTIYLIEGVGSTYGLLELSFGCALDLPDHSISCFRKNGTTEYPSNTTSCYTIDKIEEVNEDLNGLVLLLPNPSDGKFKMVLNHVQDGKVEIYNTLGAMIFTNVITYPEIDLSAFGKGIYFVKVISNEKQYDQKLVIE